MRLAVVTNQYPSTVTTFFAWGMTSLRRAGAEVDVFPLYPLEDELWPGVPEGHEVDRAHVHHIGPLHSIAALRPERRLPRFVADSATATAAAARWGPAAVAKTAYAMPKAWAWARDRRGHYDHVLAYWGNYSATCAWAMARLLDVPFSFFLHGSSDLFTNRAMLARKLRAARAVFVSCDFNRRFLAEVLPEAAREAAPRTHVHHLPVDLDALAYTRAGRDDRTILGVGRFDRPKGFHHLVAALAQLDGTVARVELIGTGPEEGALRGLAASLGVADRVDFRGWLPPGDVRAAMARAAVLVHPTTHLGDAVPTVIKEALAVGLPVVGSDVVGVPELLDGGRAGVLVPAEDPAAIAAAVRVLLADAGARDAMAATGRRFAEAQFDIATAGARLVATLRC